MACWPKAIVSAVSTRETAGLRAAMRAVWSLKLFGAFRAWQVAVGCVILCSPYLPEVGIAWSKYHTTMDFSRRQVWGIGSGQGSIQFRMSQLTVMEGPWGVAPMASGSHREMWKKYLHSHDFPSNLVKIPPKVVIWDYTDTDWGDYGLSIPGGVIGLQGARSVVVAIPYWLLAVVLASIFGLARAPGRLRRYRRRKLGLCLHCGYNLTGNVSGICPECGSEVPKDHRPVLPPAATHEKDAQPAG